MRHAKSPLASLRPVAGSIAASLLAIAIAACGNPAPTGNDAGDVATGMDVRSDMTSIGDTSTGDTPAETSAPCTTDDDCGDGVFCNGVERCMPGAPGADARGCIAAMPATPCAAGEMCVESTQRCMVNCTNADGDGDGHRAMGCGGDDCDDTDANRFPGATEVCDTMNHDEDCDPATYGVRDQDHDGYPDARCCNMDPVGMTMSCGTDCEDTRADVHPDLPEACDPAMLDENCNGMHNEMCECVDATSRPCQDATGTRALGQCAAGTQPCVSGHYASCSVQPTLEVCDGTDNDCNGMTDEGLTVVCYTDVDDDGYPGASATAMNACPAPGRGGVGGCPVHSTNRAPSAGMNDCNDANPSVFPAAPEVCNGTDDNCDGMTDEGCSCTVGMTRPCGAMGAGLVGACGVGSQTCTSMGWSATCPSPTMETCNSLDDDCDGMVDEGAMVTCYVDGDGDAYAAAGALSQIQCPVSGRPAMFGGCPVGFTANAPTSGRTDCNDSNAAVSPSAAEVCNCVDDNCSGMVDEGVRLSGFVDVDGDGWGGSPVTVCPTRCGGQPAVIVSNGGDCCDAAGGASVNPGVTTYQTAPRPSVCGGGFDYNCDGNISLSNSSLQSGTCSRTSTGTCVRSTGFRAGWDGALPGCGESGGYITGCANQRDPDTMALFCDLLYSSTPPTMGCY